MHITQYWQTNFNIQFIVGTFVHIINGLSQIFISSRIQIALHCMIPYFHSCGQGELKHLL